jgi:HD-like signal output (HDOD) protein
MNTPLSDSEIAAAVATLPPVSAVLQRILSILQDPNAPLEDIARLVRAETGLASQVLRMANSAHYGLPTAATTIDEAIQRLGIAEVSRLVTMLGSRQLILSPLKSYGISAETLWEHTLIVAVCAETLALYAERDRNSAHLAGVLHPVGMVALDRIAGARKLAQRPATTPLAAWEATVFGVNNAAIAGRVLRHWQFPEGLAAAVAGRYAPEGAGDASGAASLLHLASLLAGKVGGALPGEEGCFRLAAGRFAASGVPWDAMAEAEVEAGQNVERTRALLQIGRASG